MTPAERATPRVGGHGLWGKLGPAGLLGVIWAVAPAAGGVLLLGKISVVSDWLLADRPVGMAVYTAVFMLTAGMGLLPTYAQAFLGGWVFGFAAGFPCALMGFTGGALIGYVVARTVARHRVQDAIECNPKARAVREALIGRSWGRTLGIVTLLRVPPNSPFALMNLAMAATGVSLAPYLLGTLLGMAPRTAVYVLAAHLAARSGAKDIQQYIKDGPGLAVFVVGLGATLVVLAILGHIANRAIAKVTGPGRERAGAA